MRSLGKRGESESAREKERGERETTGYEPFDHTHVIQHNERLARSPRLLTPQPRNLRAECEMAREGEAARPHHDQGPAQSCRCKPFYHMKPKNESTCAGDEILYTHPTNEIQHNARPASSPPIIQPGCNHPHQHSRSTPIQPGCEAG